MMTNIIIDCSGNGYYISLDLIFQKEIGQNKRIRAGMGGSD